MTTYSTITLNLGFGPQSIAYFDRAASGTPVLFVHGLGNNASNFEDTLAARALADHRLIGLDLPGCGASPYPRTTRLDIDRVVKVVEAFVDANRGLTYLPRIRASRCTVTEVMNADHFLFYDAPEAFADCVRRAAVAGTVLDPERSRPADPSTLRPERTIRSA